MLSTSPEPRVRNELEARTSKPAATARSRPCRIKQMSGNAQNTKELRKLCTRSFLHSICTPHPKSSNRSRVLRSLFCYILSTCLGHLSCEPSSTYQRKEITTVYSLLGVYLRARCPMSVCECVSEVTERLEFKKSVAVSSHQEELPVAGEEDHITRPQETDATNVEEEELARSEELLLRHLSQKGLLELEVGVPRAWKLAKSPYGGRGVVTTRDLDPGDLILVDAPLVLGPRASAHTPPLCVRCHQGAVPLSACVRGCGLPVCSEGCQEGPDRHEFECRLLLSWRGGVPHEVGSWSPELLRAVTPIRCLQLTPEEREIFLSLQSHAGPQHAGELKFLKKYISDRHGPNAEDQAFMKQACCVMDANAFESRAELDKFPGPDEDWVHVKVTCTASLRGLYPLGGMLNHACTPNTRRGYDCQHRMIIRAAVPIVKGTEITNSYTALLWGTPARRHQLYTTKHFLCTCPRCEDPQEKGSLLSALRCCTSDCTGCILPEDPLNSESPWGCSTCQRSMTSQRAGVVQSALGKVLGRLDTTDPVSINRFLRGHKRVVATTNQIIVELKCNLVCIYGHAAGYQYSGKAHLVLFTCLTIRNDQCSSRYYLLPVNKSSLN
uniref:(California timema) hypothetical protein n=1 Tax=Timema californicum TaxID=61474 RepID=A0A7R9P9W1_TIMCA|nr:unnamed protein product [Timema californicum]